MLYIHIKHTDRQTYTHTHTHTQSRTHTHSYTGEPASLWTDSAFEQNGTQTGKAIEREKKKHLNLELGVKFNNFNLHYNGEQSDRTTD